MKNFKNILQFDQYYLNNSDQFSLKCVREIRDY